MLPTAKRAAFGLVMLAALFLGACGPAAEEQAPTEKAASVEAVKGTNLTRVRLTPKAALRLGIATSRVRRLRNGKHALPYSSLIYDADGKTSVYTNPEPLVFVRYDVVVERIRGPDVIVVRGPSVGTDVVTTGAPELFGIEFGIGEFE